MAAKETLSQLPKDNVIYQVVRRHGEWAFDESIFLSEGIAKLQKAPNTRVAFFDIGANVGLVTLQILRNSTDTATEFFLFEPIPNHAEAIKYNLGKFLVSNSLQIENFALGDMNGFSTIFAEISNRGNSSMFESAVPMDESISQHIETVNTSEYFLNFIDKYDAFVVKSDTQGMDASILSQIPHSIWRIVETAVSEVWALPEITVRDVDALLEMLHDFVFMSWSTDLTGSVSLNEVRIFWLSKSSESKNLFIRR